MQRETDRMQLRPSHAHPQARVAPSLETENRRLHARISELEREKADVESFAAVAAHELHAPLILADSYATAITDRLDGELHADSRRDLDALRRAAARTRLLVETLLHDARSQGRKLRRRPIDLDGVLRECLTLLAPEIDRRRANVQVPELPEVYGERALISVVFTNLLLNALRYGPRDHGTIRVDATPEDAGWRLSVQSQGAPIPVEDRVRIFEPYHRGRGERRARGAGLGLAICQQIVERHGGEIGVTVAPNGDNRFYFTLPA
jgi:signal transduction histidine kinase